VRSAQNLARQSRAGDAVERAVKCLLVDDLEENLLALRALLQRDDVELLSARSAPEALELLLRHEIALALIDVQMPDMDGLELAELMRGSERTRQVPIIFVTAGTRDQHHVFKGYESGAVDFLYKPIEPHILRNKADVFFQLYRQKQQLALELQERTETLRLNEMFAAVLGHDLRSPLSAILSSAYQIQRHSEDQSAREAATRMLVSGRRMGRMIDDMLDLARARLGGGIPLQPEPVDLRVLVQRVVREHQAAFPERHIDLHEDGDLSGQWDPIRLAQVASNLIGNALQHGERNESIRVRLDGTHAQWATFSVSNAGMIAPAVLPHLFDPLAGGQQPNRGRGLGLGLYIVQQIVQAHRGSVEVQSNNGTHTVFSVKVPRNPQS
jgi:two-component system, sensor histidine kinase and response regulator